MTSDMIYLPDTISSPFVSRKMHIQHFNNSDIMGERREEEEEGDGPTMNIEEKREMINSIKSDTRNEEDEEEAKMNASDDLGTLDDFAPPEQNATHDSFDAKNDNSSSITDVNHPSIGEKSTVSTTTPYAVSDQMVKSSTEMSHVYRVPHKSDVRVFSGTRRKRAHMLKLPSSNEPINGDGGSDTSGEENDNDSTCNECHGGGELLCCDGCVKAYHAGCLTPSKRPRYDSEGDWYCPDCKLCGMDARSRGDGGDGGRNKAGFANENDASSEGVAVDSMEAKNVPNRGNNAASNVRSKGNGVYRIKPATNRILTEGGAAAGVDPRFQKKKKKVIDEGQNDANRINVGPRYQVPAFPSFYLDREERDAFYQKPVDQAKLVFSPMCLEQVRQKRTMEGRSSWAIQSDEELTLFVKKCASNWKTQAGWQPFSPEFAYKLLHCAEYNPERALQLMGDPHFSFQLACDPPMRKYENKWKPRDRRGGGAMTPYPPPIAVKGYLSRRQHNTAYMLR